MKEYKGYKYKQEGNTWTVYTKEGKAWVVEIPSEEKAKAQIDDIIASQESVQNEKTEIEQIKEQITELQLAMVESEV